MVGVLEVILVSKGLQDQKDLVDRWVQRERGEKSLPAPLTLLPNRAPQVPLAPVETLERKDLAEKLA